MGSTILSRNPCQVIAGSDPMARISSLSIERHPVRRPWPSLIDPSWRHDRDTRRNLPTPQGPSRGRLDHRTISWPSDPKEGGRGGAPNRIKNKSLKQPNGADFDSWITFFTRNETKRNESGSWHLQLPFRNGPLLARIYDNTDPDMPRTFSSSKPRGGWAVSNEDTEIRPLFIAWL